MENNINTKAQINNQNSKGENKMAMAQKAYTKEILNDLVHLLDIKADYKVKDQAGFYSIVFYSDDGYSSIYIDLQLASDIEKTLAYRKRHPEATIYNITGFELSVASLQTSSASEAEFLLMQYQQAIKIVKMFKEIAEGKSVLIENL